MNDDATLDQIIAASDATATAVWCPECESAFATATFVHRISMDGVTDGVLFTCSCCGDREECWEDD